MANDYGIATKEVHDAVTKAAERITGTRWCGFGRHYVDPADGVWLMRRHFKLFCCARCLAQRTKAKAVTA